MQNNIIFFDLECVYDDNHKQDLDQCITKWGEDKCNFLPELNSILTICVGYINNTGVNVIKGLEGSEQEQIKEFFKLSEKYTLCGFNILNFDIPFIIKRALYHGIKIPDKLKQYGKKSREITNILDLQEVYKMNVWGATGNLDTTCKHLGIISPKQEGIDGSQVQQLHDDGKDDEIIKYCIRDVESCMELYKKFLELNLI